ncbi:KH domain-containing protein HEN4 [Impatiens glandulifera]|uniref:KH domain-containing protein HEN4 n=1 Tax=Impatiens glandulifera TaxID=253017 RepID=UPI001FB10EED|nr:KH domain-containing protein HEN4 [Impatiens glandulifera]
MEDSFTPKRPPDTSTFDWSELPPAKRRHHQPLPFFKIAFNEAVFRILCPAKKTGLVIGKGGAVVRQLCDETGARIRIDDSDPEFEERVIIIVGDSSKRETNSTSDANQTGSNTEHVGSSAQQGLVRVFERIAKVVADRNWVSTEGNEKGEERQESVGDVGVNGAVTPPAPIVCKLLAPGNQVGCVFGRGRNVIERIRHDSGAKVRVLSSDQIPPCSFPGDELIHISGNFQAVKKALLYVSSCLQDSQVHAAGNRSAGPNKKIIEEEIVFKLLCKADKVGALIGKGGCVIRALENDTGASIKIRDETTDLDERVVERVVLISARENSEQRYSAAQEAVIRAHNRITEVGFELGAPVVARLLVHPHLVGFLMGKGGLIPELRRVTGASINIFHKEQVANYGQVSDDVVQVMGSLPCVQDVLFQITSRIREIILPTEPYMSNSGGPHFMPPYSEMPLPMLPPRHDPSFPGAYPSPAGPPLDQQPHSHGMDHSGPNYFERFAHTQGGGPPNVPSFDTQCSPRSWVPQNMNTGGFVMANGPMGSGNHQVRNAASTNLEIVIPRMFLGHVSGDRNCNLGHIRQISGAIVEIQDPSPGATEGVVMVSGTPEQLYLAQTMIHAFIQSELTF